MTTRTPEGSLIRWASVLVLIVTSLTACDEELPDAFGNFESVEVAVAAEANGPIVQLDLAEGMVLSAGAIVGQIDTVQLALQHRELTIQHQAAGTRRVEAGAAVRALEAQLNSAQQDLDRTQRLFSNRVATAAELTRLEGTVASLTAQIDGARARVELAGHEQATLSARLDQLRDRLERATIRSPVSGTVLTTFVERGEFVQPGRTLYTIAPLDTLVLRAYVSGDQLSDLELGGSVAVRFDSGPDTMDERAGRISWISSEAEFTPTPIQTREERVDQVYAVKVRVPNPDGALKIGMPGEIVLGSSPEGSDL